MNHILKIVFLFVTVLLVGCNKWYSKNVLVKKANYMLEYSKYLDDNDSLVQMKIGNTVLSGYVVKIEDTTYFFDTFNALENGVGPTMSITDSVVLFYSQIIERGGRIERDGVLVVEVDLYNEFHDNPIKYSLYPYYKYDLKTEKGVFFIDTFLDKSSKVFFRIR